MDDEKRSKNNKFKRKYKAKVAEATAVKKSRYNSKSFNEGAIHDVTVPAKCRYSYSYNNTYNKNNHNDKNKNNSKIAMQLKYFGEEDHYNNNKNNVDDEKRYYCAVTTTATTTATLMHYKTAAIATTTLIAKERFLLCQLQQRKQSTTTTAPTYKEPKHHQIKLILLNNQHQEQQQHQIKQQQQLQTQQRHAEKCENKPNISNNHSTPSNTNNNNNNKVNNKKYATDFKTSCKCVIVYNNNNNTYNSNNDKNLNIINNKKTSNNNVDENDNDNDNNDDDDDDKRLKCTNEYKWSSHTSLCLWLWLWIRQQLCSNALVVMILLLFLLIQQFWLWLLQILSHVSNTLVTNSHNYNYIDYKNVLGLLCSFGMQQQQHRRRQKTKPQSHIKVETQVVGEKKATTKIKRDQLLLMPSFLSSFLRALSSITIFRLFLITQLLVMTTTTSFIVYCNQLQEQQQYINVEVATHANTNVGKNSIDTTVLPSLYDNISVHERNSINNYKDSNPETLISTTTIDTYQLQQEQQQQHQAQKLTNSHKKVNSDYSPFIEVAEHAVTPMEDSNSNRIKSINRHQLFRQHYEMHALREDNLNTGKSFHHNQQHHKQTKSSGSSSSSCISCQMREKAKIDSLNMIKMQILLRLQFTKMPNITTPVAVPQKIIDDFYESQYGRSKKATESKSDKNYHFTTVSNFENENRDQKDIMKFKRGLNSDSAENAEKFDDTDERSEIYMQQDDPNSYRDVVESVESNYFKIETKFDKNHYSADYHTDINDHDDDDNDYDEDQVYPRINSIYIFPTSPRIRHNRKPEILNFNFENINSFILRTIMHVYIHGHDWMRENNPSLLDQLNADGVSSSSPVKRNEIIIGVYRAVRSSANKSNFTHTIKLLESRHSIPSGLGQWIQIDLKPLTTMPWWKKNVTQNIFVRGTESWMRSLIETGDNGPNRSLSIHIEVLTENKFRRKRSTSLDCTESDRETRCCRYPLTVNFTSFGWTWVIAPLSFDAYFCNGDCKVGYLEEYAHTHIASLTTSATPCCSPTKMSPLSLLYFNNHNVLVRSTIPNMSVEKCSCS